MTSIGDRISQVRDIIKATKQDAFITDRFIFGLIKTNLDWILSREDGMMKLMGFQGIHQTIDYIELIEVDKVQAGCRNLKSGCTIKRTKKELPDFYTGYNGPLITSITGISGNATDADDEGEFHPTTPGDYANLVKSSSFKYNKTRYYWYLNNHLYFPNLEWDAVKLEGISFSDLSEYDCEEEKPKCKRIQDGSFNIPDKLFAEVRSFVLKDMGITFQIPSDPVDDKTAITR